MVALNNGAGSSSSRSSSNPKRKRRSVEDGVSSVERRTSAESDVLTRTSWADARVGLALLKQNKATGNKASLYLRAKLQSGLLLPLGRWIQRNAGKVLAAGAVVFVALMAVGLRSVNLENRVDRLWVEEGGRLERELSYVSEHLGEGAGATSQMLIQTPKSLEFGTVLTPEALLSHLDILKAAAKIVVETEDTTWDLKDICFAQTIPTSENMILDQIFEKLFPCTIITPLDCFWEGSKLLGPDIPVRAPLGEDDGSMLLSWMTLNPMSLVREMGERFSTNYFDFRAFEEYMKRAGITSGYQEKPCLDPYDPDCPPTAPNKLSKQRPDVGAELTGGCYGFATRYNHWPEQLVVGGVQKNASGHIVQAKGLQSVIQLMGERDLYEYWSETYKTHTMSWTPDRARQILAEWQRQFAEEVAEIIKEDKNSKFDVAAFSASQLDSVLERFAEFGWARMAVGFALMLAYTMFVLFRWTDVVYSQAGLGFSGVVLVAVTIAAGLGLCAIIGLDFNATTSQVLPYLAMGLGVDAVFLMVRTYAERLVEADGVFEDQVGEVLSRTGVLIVVSGACLVSSLLLAALLVPIPAMRGLGFQAAVLGGLNLASMVLLFPAMLALDLRRVAAGRADVACCYSGRIDLLTRIKSWFGNDESKQQQQSGSERSANLLHRADEKMPGSKTIKTITSSVELPSQEDDNTKESKDLISAYANWLTKRPAKLLVWVLYIALTVAGAWGATKLKDGLSLDEVVPRETPVAKFLQAQDRHFGFHNVYAVTQGNVEYPQVQATLYDYHKAFVGVGAIIKNDNGGLPEFWLPLFRNWLVRLQGVFDDHVADGRYGATHRETPGKPWANASAEGILAYKLMVQTGHVDYPVDESLIHTNRLVDAHGIINPAAFYNYLSAWYGNDPMAYSFSQAAIRPRPKDWVHNHLDAGLRIPKSSPIAFAQIPFYLAGLDSDEETVAAVKEIRQVCDDFVARGLPNFPRGVPFTYWEQYLTLRLWLSVALGCAAGCVFAALSAAFCSAHAGLVAIVPVVGMVVQLVGLMGVVGVGLSAIPAVILILSAGIGVHFTVTILMGFVTAIGNKNRRSLLAVQHMAPPVVHGAVTTFLGVLMLAFSDFDFIYRYFFVLLTAVLVLGAFNSLAFLPVLLSALGPPAEVIPSHDDPDRISLPSPDPEPRIAYNTRSSSNRKQKLHVSSPATNLRPSRRHDSDDSLSTIPEESKSYCSTSVDQHNRQQQRGGLSSTSSSFNGGGASVFVEPEVIVETTTLPSSADGAAGGGSRSSTPNQKMRVTATFKMGVEVHAAPLDRPQTRRSRRSRSQNNQSSGSSSSDNSNPPSVSSSISSTGGDLGFSEK